MTSEEIRKAIKEKYPNETYNNAWVILEELKNGNGFGKIVDGRMDVFVMSMFPSKRFQRIAFEIKISKSDFMNEIKNPNKRRFAMAISNEFYFIAPKGVLNPEEIPQDCGLMEVEEVSPKNYYIDTTLPAIWRETMPPNWAFVASICRRIYKAEKV